MVDRIHVIDPDVRRRAQIAHELHSWNVHAEIYEGLDEFRSTSPDEGFVFAADDEIPSATAELSEAMRANGNPLPVVMYAEHPATERVVSAMRLGALDYLEWPFDAQRLGATFRRLDADGHRLRQSERLRAAARSKVAGLSAREGEVLVRLVQGMSNKQIANVLRISPRTVEIHRGNMMAKLNARAPADAVRIALYAGLEDDFRLVA